MRFFEWWGGLDWKLRYGVAVALLLISTVLYFSGEFWPWGWVAGGVLLAFSGKTSSEAKGYNF